MALFKPIQYFPLATSSNSDIWQEYKQLQIRKETGACNFVDYHPILHDRFVFTCGSKVIVANHCNPDNNLKNFSRFKESVYGARWRIDGSLLCCGDERGRLYVLDPKHGSQLRQIKAHTQAVHSCTFTCNNNNILSTSDDKSIKLWDISTSQAVVSFVNAHSDYIRSVESCNNKPGIFITGSYDHYVNMWDERIPKSSIMQLNHGSPIQQVLFSSNNTICLSAGGNCVKIWDLLAGGKLMAKLLDHHKTPTSISFSANNQYLMTGGLDKRILVYDWNGFTYRKSFNICAPILSMSVSKGCSYFSVGLEDGLLVSYRKNPKFKDIYKEDNIVENEIAKPINYSEVDKYLKKFEHGEALEAALRKHQGNKHPEFVVAILQELIRRNVLHASIASRQYKSLEHLINFILRNIGIQRFTGTMIDIANAILDIELQTNHSPPDELVKLLKKLKFIVHKEMEACDKISQLQGSIELILNSFETNK